MKKVIVVKAIVFDTDGHVLLVRRSDTAPRRPLEWDIPGGFVDEGDESLQRACLREVREETGIDVSEDTLHLVYTESDCVALGTKTAHDVSWLYFAVRAATTDVHLSYEHDTFAWVTLPQALDMIVYDRQLTALRYLQKIRGADS